MTNKLVVIINILKVPKIKKILLYEMKFLVPNYSCLQNPWVEGYSPQIPVLSVLCLQLNLLNSPLPEQNSWVRHCQKYLGSSREDWRRSVDPIVWNSVPNNQGGKKYLHTTNRRQAYWIGRILHRNGLIKHVIEGKMEEEIEWTRRQWRIRKQLLDDLKETRIYWKLSEEAIDRSV